MSNIKKNILLTSGKTCPCLAFPVCLSVPTYCPDNSAHFFFIFFEVKKVNKQTNNSCKMIVLLDLLLSGIIPEASLSFPPALSSCAWEAVLKRTDWSWVSVQLHLLMLQPSNASPKMVSVLNVSVQQHLAKKIHHTEFLWTECDFIQKELC